MVQRGYWATETSRPSAHMVTLLLSELAPRNDGDRRESPALADGGVLPVRACPLLPRSGGVAPRPAHAPRDGRSAGWRSARRVSAWRRLPGPRLSRPAARWPATDAARRPRTSSRRTTCRCCSGAAWRSWACPPAGAAGCPPPGRRPSRAGLWPPRPACSPPAPAGRHLRKGAAVGAPLAAKARRARLLLARLDAAEGRLKRQVEAHGDVPQDLRLYARQTGPLRRERGQRRVLVVEAHRLPTRLPSITPFREQVVVQPAALLHLPIEEAPLLAGRVQPVPERLTQANSLTQCALTQCAPPLKPEGPFIPRLNAGASWPPLR